MTIALALAFVVVGVWLLGRRSPEHPLMGRWRDAQESSRRGLEDQRSLVEAIASWTEGLRDAISGCSGIEQAILSTGKFSPEVIAPHVNRLVASLRYEPMGTALRRFSADVDHPTCDFVVVALLTAAEHQTRDLSRLLSHLSECARAECDSYLRIWVSRARTRSSVRIISWSVGVFTCGLFVFNRTYLLPYLSPMGAVVGSVVLVIYCVSFVWLHRIAEIDSPRRLLTLPATGGQR